LRSSGQRYDICLVDGYHTYACSQRDLSEAFGLLADGGALVVHDCLPIDAAVASPHWIPDRWCGVTYKAFLDFVARRSDIDYYTVDTDFGCGVVVKDRRWWATAGRLAQRGRRRLSPDARARIIRGWLETGDDLARAFDYFERHKATLLQLISVDQFLDRTEARPASTRPSQPSSRPSA
jgi:hypothetical protein